MNPTTKILSVSMESPLSKIGGMGQCIDHFYRRLAADHDIVHVGVSQSQGREFWHVDSWGRAERCARSDWTHRPGSFRVFHPFMANEMGVSERPWCDWQLDAMLTLNMLECVSPVFAPDLIHQHDGHPHYAVASIKSLEAGRGRRVPIVYHSHLNPMSAFTDGQPLDKSMIQRCSLEWYSMQRADRVVAISSDYRRRLEEFLVPAEKIADVPNGVDAAALGRVVPDWETARRLGVPVNTNKTIVGFVGRLVTTKGIEAMCQAAVALPDHHFVLASNRQGTCEDDYHIKMLRESAAVNGNVTWLDAMGFEEKWPILKGVDVAAMPSTHEPFGLVGLEWMALGKPLVYSDIDGLKDFAVGVPIASNAESLIAALKLRSWEHVDTTRARAVAASYTWEATAQKLREVYQSCLRS